MINQQLFRGLRSSFYEMCRKYLGGAAFMEPEEIVLATMRRQAKSRTITVGSMPGSTYTSLELAFEALRREPDSSGVVTVALQPGIHTIGSPITVQDMPRIDIVSRDPAVQVAVKTGSNYAISGATGDYTMVIPLATMPDGVFSVGMPVMYRPYTDIRTAAQGLANAKHLSLGGVYKVVAMDSVAKTISVKVRSQIANLGTDLNATPMPTGGAVVAATSAIRLSSLSGFQLWNGVLGFGSLAPNGDLTPVFVMGTYDGTNTGLSTLVYQYGGTVEGEIYTTETHYTIYGIGGQSELSVWGSNCGRVLTSDAALSVYSELCFVTNSGMGSPNGAVHLHRDAKARFGRVYALANLGNGVVLRTGAEGVVAASFMSCYNTGNGLLGEDGASFTATVGELANVASFNGAHGVRVAQASLYEAGGVSATQNTQLGLFSDFCSKLTVAGTAVLTGNGQAAAAAVTESTVVLQTVAATGLAFSPAINTVGNSNSVIRTNQSAEIPSGTTA